MTKIHQDATKCKMHVKALTRCWRWLYLSWKTFRRNIRAKETRIIGKESEVHRDTDTVLYQRSKWNPKDHWAWDVD